MRSLLALLVAAALSVPLAAHAQKPTVVVTPPHVKGRVDDALLAGIVTELEEAFRAQGWQVTGLTDALRLPVSSNGPCNNNACALAYAEAAHTSTALQLSVFGTSSVTFSLALVQPPGDAFVHGGAFADPSRPADSIAQAAKDLVSQHARGAGPWLIVNGNPIDAAVRLDGDVVGVVPLRRRIAGGEHLIVVSAEGYDDYNNTIWLDNVAGAVKEISVTLTPAQASTEATSTRGPDRGFFVPLKPADWLVGGGAVAAGLVYLATGLVHRAQDGACLDEHEGACVQRADADHRTSTQLIVGASATAFGAAWLLVAPFGRWITPSATRAEARLTFTAEF